MKAPKIPAPTAAPPPKPIPQPTDPSVREAEIEGTRQSRKRKGARSTMLGGALGDGDYSQADQARSAANRVLG